MFQCLPMTDSKETSENQLPTFRLRSMFELSESSSFSAVYLNPCLVQDSFSFNSHNPNTNIKKKHTPKTRPQKTKTTKPTNGPFHLFHLGSAYASVPGRRRYSRLRLKMPMGARDPIACHRGHRWGIRILVIHGPSKVAHFKA